MEIINIKNDCRICYEEVNNNLVVCDCKGSMGYVHQKCLLKWFEIDKDNIKFRKKIIKQCELCNKEIEILIYKPFMFYSYLIFFMFLYLLLILYITDSKNNTLQDNISYSIIYLILGIIYYSFIVLILHRFYKNKISFN